MKLALPSQIKKIDAFAIESLGIPAVELMGRSGRAVAEAVRALAPRGGSVVILAGKGNNGGDGYAAACELNSEYRVKLIDVFSAGQRTEEGRYYLDKFALIGGCICTPGEIESIAADVIVDAIFGTGFLGEPPESLSILADLVEASNAKKIAVDVPLGVNADNGSVSEIHIRADITIALSYLKPGLLSYPAKEYCGNVILDTIGMPRDEIEKYIDFSSFLFDGKEAISALPKRDSNSNKGSFGKALLVTGSKTYPGAGILTLEAALRGGAGYVTQIADSSDIEAYIRLLPETLFARDLILDGEYDIECILALAEKSSSILIGSGCEATSSLADLTEELVKSRGAPLIIDASAINALAKYKSKEILKKSKRKVVLTPHPLELSRLLGVTTDEIQANRIGVARDFAKEYGVILVLKGAATVTTDGNVTYINSSGSSALAKAGSGDVLAGLLASLLAYCSDYVKATALAVYLHGKAADNLSSVLSKFGVIPSDLPIEIAKEIREIEKTKGE